ncbi:hypothetical protein C8R45DRAFT_957166 [Mycena sanguinolenta]|nr:hypothetical protein C8R45DRAFT_957166 [Mycena sanguinolenta]
MASLLPPPFNPDVTLGALEIGVLVSYVLFGITTVQTYIYSTRFPDDPWKLKAFVAFVLLCEFAHAICIGDTVYTYTITNYGHPERLLLPVPKSLEVSVFFSGVIAASVQCFFSYRIYVISQSVYIPCFTWTLALLRCAFSTLAFGSGIHMHTLGSYESQWGWLAITLWSVSAANDVIIAAILVYLFFRRRNGALELRNRRTAMLVDRLIAWTIETGTVTSVFGVITLLCYVTMVANFIWLALVVITARLFSNSLLASLNSRATLRAMSEASVTPTTPVPTINFARSNESTSKATQSPV